MTHRRILKITTASILGLTLSAGVVMAQDVGGVSSDRGQTSVNYLLYNADSVTQGSMLGKTYEAMEAVTRDHTIPGAIKNIRNLQTSLANMDNSNTDKAEAMLHIAALYLRSIGNTNSAAIISTGATIAAQNNSEKSAGFMKGIAQDLRQAGAIRAAIYLEPRAQLVEEGVQDPITGVMDAASLALRFGVAPQPNLAEILSYDLDEVGFETFESLTIGINTQFQNLTGDDRYAFISDKVREITPEKVEEIRANILAAKAQQKAEHDASVGRIQTQPQSQ